MSKLDPNLLPLEKAVSFSAGYALGLNRASNLIGVAPLAVLDVEDKAEIANAVRVGRMDPKLLPEAWRP